MNAESLVPAVVDASVVVKWLLTEPDSAAAIEQRRQWHTEGVVPAAPDFLLIELHNILWKKLQRGDITPDAPILSYAPTFGLDVNWFPFEPILPLAWSLSVRYDISIYDALYAGLAQHLRAMFFTADTRLAERLGKAVSVHLLAPAS